MFAAVLPCVQGHNLDVRQQNFVVCSLLLFSYSQVELHTLSGLQTAQYHLTSADVAGLASVPGTEGLQIAHKWLADLLVYFSKDVTAYSAVRLVRISHHRHCKFLPGTADQLQYCSCCSWCEGSAVCCFPLACCELASMQFVFWLLQVAVCKCLFASCAALSQIYSLILLAAIVVKLCWMCHSALCI